MKNIFTLFLLTIFGFTAAHAQVTTYPALPTADQSITLYLDASITALAGYPGEVYAHTGLTINGTQWSNVIGDWGDNNAQPQLTRISTDYYKLEMTPTIRAFYGAGAGDDITEICIVFRSAGDPYQQTSPDIFIPVFEPELNVLLVSPAGSPYFVDAGESIDINAQSIYSDSLHLYIDGNLEVSTTENLIEYDMYAGATANTKHWIKTVGFGEGETRADSNYVYVRGANVVEALPEGVMDGINYIDDETVTLVLHAPYKSSVYAIGDFNNWQVGPEYRMKSTLSDVNDLETRYWLTLENLVPGQEYIFQYLVDENLKIGDPYAEKVSDPWNDEYISETTYAGILAYPEGKTQGIATVLQTQQPEYEWQIEDFTPLAVEEMVVYELLVRDFTDQHTFESLIDTMNYFKRLGVNVIELMPVNEFEGNISWGYNPNYYFAVDKYYGPKNTLKAFIDECHANNIAVVIDMVLNHSFGTSPMVMLYWDANNNQPAADNIWFNQVAKHDYNVGMDFNHESPYTRAFTKRVNDFWLTEYNIDGFRFDLSKGFTQTNTLGNTNQWGQYDQSRIDIWDDYSSAIWETKADAWVILEHFANNDEEKVLSNDGMMLWGNHNCNYNQATMGHASGPCNWDFSGISYKQRSWNNPHLIGYMESHDEERLQYKNILYGNSVAGYNIKDSAVGLQRNALAASFFFTIPGPKMIWQFGEMGYDYSIDFNGRTGPKPIRWDYLNDWRREYLFHVYAALIQLKTEYAVFNTSDFTLDVSNAQKSIILRSSDMNVVVLGNFGIEQADVDLIWPGLGTWYEFFTQSELEILATDQSVELDRGEYRIYSSQQIAKPIWLNTAIGEIGNIQKQSIVSVYPNPARDIINFKIKTKTPESANISIYTIMGEKVATLEPSELQAGMNKISYNIQQKLKSGVYFATIIIGTIQESVFFVVE